MARVTVVSDTHLSPAAPEALLSWDAVVDHVGSLRPDLVIHAGDVTLDGANDPSELAAARDQLDRLAVPWLAVPGNHDTGDTPPTEGGRDVPIDADRRARWVDALGPDWWCATTGGWTIVALDGQLLGSGLDDEQLQWRWVEETVAGLDPTRPLLLVMHKPMATTAEERAEGSRRRFAPEPATRRLDQLTVGHNLRAVLSGHVHQHRLAERGGVAQVWAPTTWAVLPDSHQPLYGEKRCGVLSLSLEADGTFDVAAVEPDGLAQRVLGSDLVDPYHR
ncbi:metallophosphoesterase [Acidiferrimicrobium sp. IK]|uniref:metallophosphoesterase family protein n=1 Tax=Acidiferrimicrobium sp. IK TaxID=2871700 RepID=UPI0021CB2A0A|nr:metallophosphoesterase [Acidiferrimicrobium sp. IK]MCU4183642.1 metallophosphoesterase [Acidiferrimicrobium sp. IK]